MTSHSRLHQLLLALVLTTLGLVAAPSAFAGFSAGGSTNCAIENGQPCIVTPL